MILISLASKYNFKYVAIHVWIFVKVTTNFTPCGSIQVLGNKSDKSELNSQRNYEQIKSGECLIPFCSESPL